jgi:purine-binding chemotaxis protein CheW
MRGVINLRGSVIPVIDFRLKFDLPTAEKTVNTRIIVMELEYDGSTVTVGAIADSVQEVINLDPENIDPAPKIGTTIDTDYISGIGKINDDFLILLDLQKIFQDNELETLKESKRMASKEKVPVSG